MKTLIRNSILSALVLTCMLNNVNSQDWPQWRGINRDGKVTGFKAPQTWPQQLTQTWKVAVGLGDATPALVKDRLYVYSKIGENEVLQCIDAASGKQVWQSDGYPSTAVTGPAASHPGPRGSVTVADGKAIVTGVAGDIACFDISNGKLIWRNESFKGQVPQFFTGMSPLVISGVCYAHLGGPKTGSILAFDLASGNIKWKVDGEGPAYGSPAFMSVGGTMQIIFQSMTKLLSFDATEGKLLWEHATPSGSGRVMNSTSPVIDGNKIYFTGMNNGVNAIEIKKDGSAYTATSLWTNSEFSTSYSTPVVKDGNIYGVSSLRKLFCLNASTGQTAWKDDTVLHEFGSIVDAGNTIIVLTSNSSLVVIKPDGQKYNQAANYKLAETGIYAYPIISGNRIYIKDNENLTLFTL